MSNETEIWKDVDGYDGVYQVSTLGRFKSVDRIVKCKNGAKKLYRGRMMKAVVANMGYYCLNMSKNGNVKSCHLHRLVAEAFISNPENKRTVNHIDGNKLNNCVANLEWATDSENNQHAVDNNLRNIKVGEAVSKAKLTELDVLEIRRLKHSGMSGPAIAELFPVGVTAIYSVINKLNWTHV